MIDLLPPSDEEIEKMIDNEFMERARGLAPTSWKWYAKLLKHAADVLLERYKPAIKELSSQKSGRMNVPEEEWFERDIRLISAYYLLMGLSIENLAKGIVMVRHPDYLKNYIELKKRIGTHNINGLLKSNNIYGFADDEEILNALSKCVLWASKYPVPFKREEFDWGCDWMDPDAIERLYNKLYERLEEEEKERFAIK